MGNNKGNLKAKKMILAGLCAVLTIVFAGFIVSDHLEKSAEHEYLLELREEWKN